MLAISLAWLSPFSLGTPDTTISNAGEIETILDKSKHVCRRQGITTPEIKCVLRHKLMKTRHKIRFCDDCYSAHVYSLGPILSPACSSRIPMPTQCHGHSGEKIFD